MVMPHVFDPVGFIAEFIFTILAVLFCFLIFLRTSESYELTKHRGIKYFRMAFLFFGLSYLMKFFFGLMFLSRVVFDFGLPKQFFMPLFMLPLVYFSTIGIFYLLFSLIWKKFDNTNLIVTGNSIAIVFSLASFLTRSPIIILFLQFTLLLTATFLVIFTHSINKSISKTKVLNLLVISLWLIEILILCSAPFFPLYVEIISQIVSIIIFTSIYYRTLKWVR